jgi:glycosyltransferase involved in cell wall biosynthesis
MSGSILILLILFALASIVLLAYYLLVFNKVSRFKAPSPKSGKEYPPVSVIICARNEKENLEKFLPSVLDQDYPEFEVIVVDDGSWEGTHDFLDELDKLVPHLKVVTLNIEERFHRGKKFAVTMGIKAAKHNRLLLTDADCQPATPHWITSMMNAIDDKTDIIIGYSPYKKGWAPLNWFIQFETLHTALQYLGHALNGMPYMGVGRNLSYTRDLFFRRKGFARHQHLLSGDDDLFVNECATPENTRVQIVKESFVETLPKKNFKRWWKQKSRHLSTGNHYKLKHKFWLGLYASMHLLFYGTFVALLIMGFDWRILLGIFGFKTLLQYVVFVPAARKLESTRPLVMLPLLDMVFVFYNVFVGVRSIFIKPEKWS